MLKPWLAASTALAIAGFAMPGVAAPITFSGTDGDRAATATFDTSGGNLVVTLTNTGDDVLAPDQVLTALFFSSTAGALTPVSALLGAGPGVLFAPGPVGNDMGGEWAYASGLVGAPGGATQGISSVGLSLFGPGDLFGGPNLSGPVGPNGLQYGITSDSDDPTTGNAAVTGGNELIQHQVVFTFSLADATFDPSAPGAITNVVFQYGTDLSEPSIPGGGGGGPGPGTDVPEPASLAILGLALAGLGAARSRRGRKS